MFIRYSLEKLSLKLANEKLQLLKHKQSILALFKMHSIHFVEK